MNNKYRIQYQRISNPEHSRSRTQWWDSHKIIEAPTADDAIAKFIEKHTFIILNEETLGYRVPYIDRCTVEK